MGAMGPNSGHLNADRHVDALIGIAVKDCASTPWGGANSTQRTAGMPFLVITRAIASASVGTIASTTRGLPLSTAGGTGIVSSGELTNRHEVSASLLARPTANSSILTQT